MDDQAKQIEMAEDLLFGQAKEHGVAKSLFFGKFKADQAYPFPSESEKQKCEVFLKELETLLEEKLDPVAIDENAEIPQEVIQGLGNIGMMGLTIPEAYGGKNTSQYIYCQAMERVAARCGGTAVFINAHQSIGLRAILLNGSKKQKDTFLPKLASGEMLAAFALTEPQAGSDAAGVQTRAEYDETKKVYRINGEKRWITNGGIAGVLTLMAQTKVKTSKGEEDKITAFLVTPDMPGFKVIEKALKKVGIRGTMTAKLSFTDMEVPEENILGELGGGLKMALTVLDYGRLTFGASCTGAAKELVKRACQHTAERTQFGKPLASFGMVKHKLAQMSAYAYAMDATTYLTAGMFDQGEEDVMLETAILKVFASDCLWTIVNDTIQVIGGKAFFCDEPYERMMRDARLNMIGEGANEVLRVFIGLVGMRDVGMKLKDLQGMFKSPIKHFDHILQFAWDTMKHSYFSDPMTCKSKALEDASIELSQDLELFNRSILKVLMRYKESVVDQQLDCNRIATAAMSLFTSMAVLSKLDQELINNSNPDIETDLQRGLLYCKLARMRTKRSLNTLFHPIDSLEMQLAENLTGVK